MAIAPTWGVEQEGPETKAHFSTSFLSFDSSPLDVIYFVASFSTDDADVTELATTFVMDVVLSQLGDFCGEDSFELDADEAPDSVLLNSGNGNCLTWLLEVDEFLSKYETFGTLGLYVKSRVVNVMVRISAWSMFTRFGELRPGGAAIGDYANCR